MSEEKTYNGVDLINKILEFIAMTPNDFEWNYKSLSSNESRLIRLKQIDSLFNALELNKSDQNLIDKTLPSFNKSLKQEINSVLSGDFINTDDVIATREVYEFMKKYLLEKYNDLGEVREIRSFELKFIYPKLLNYKTKLRELLTFNSGWLEASATSAFFHITLTNSISSNLENKYDDLDKILDLIINPKNLKFTEKELIEKYNYPTADLGQIDRDNY